MKPPITVVVVSYQRYDHLPIIIHSFLTQTNPNWRMVILHDGPDQQHQAVVQPYLDKYSNISYFKVRFDTMITGIHFVNGHWMSLLIQIGYCKPMMTTIMFQHALTNA